MRTFLILLIAAAALASCNPRQVRLSADDCWSVSIGDNVVGEATLFAYTGRDCIECGMQLLRKNCLPVPFTTADGEAERAVYRIAKTTKPDNAGFTTRVIHLAGDVVPYGATQKPMIRASRVTVSHVPISR
jgi:hypothetical protein